MGEPITTNPENIPNEHRVLNAWNTKEILVLGMTYPAYSNKYTELVCTGAIEEDTKRLIRIHPMPKRYLDEGQGFKNFQRIEARVQRNRHDPRPESIRVDFPSVRPLDEIPAKTPEARRAYLEQSPSLVRSVEELQGLNARFGMSLGIVVPKSIDVKIRKRTPSERAEWYATERKFMSQKTLELVRPPKKIDFPEAEFLVTWTCNDPRCTKGHTSGLRSWSIHEGYRKLKRDPARDKKMLETMEREFDLTKRDVFLFLGTFHNHQTTFGLMDAYRPKKRIVEAPSPQLGLFARS
ncbi:MAG: hypothetical protein BGO98_29595 [Myxococcales bacterium 68-20]|nr:hypothetical protein [Myxococcales bacterium]OJY30914.1 MAG: hypothetical protein BGO98_29595 [Myxococcales bacterium 68-20]